MSHLASTRPSSSIRLKIFSNRSGLPADIRHVEMLSPFFGKNPEDSEGPESGCYDRYIDTGRAFFELTSLEEADLAVLPVPWEHVREGRVPMNFALRFAEEARTAAKPLAVFFLHDSTEAIPVDDALVFRTSLYRTRRSPREFAMPAWSEDFVQKYMGGRVVIRQKKHRPTVGFCGFAPPIEQGVQRTMRGIVSGAKWFLRWHPDPFVRARLLGRGLRTHAMQLLAEAERVSTNFLVRSQFLGGAMRADGTEDPVRYLKVRAEYVQNMVDSDYVLCVRGVGNFSYRLYETLCCGRIPIFLDTDCVLPYDFVIDWKQYTVWVGASELPRIAEIVGAFHESLSPTEFVTLQHECRRLWEKWLSPEGFFRNFTLHFRGA